MNISQKIILGSQSPQRKALLQTLFAPERITICPPLHSGEAGFEGITDRTAIEKQLVEIAATKCQDVFNQQVENDWAAIVTADTVVIIDDSGMSRVLGKPDGVGWQATVREWFLNFYSAAKHDVVTAVQFQFPDGTQQSILVSTQVRFHKVNLELLEWYIQTEEPLGKAGGYGIQSAGSLFVESFSGSLSNVIGFPLERVWEILKERELLK